MRLFLTLLACVFCFDSAWGQTEINHRQSDLQVLSDWPWLAPERGKYVKSPTRNSRRHNNTLRGAV